MLDKGALIFWEAFDPDEEDKGITSFYDRPYGRSLCHAWSAGPCQLLPETVLGICPIADGWREQFELGIGYRTHASTLLQTFVLHGLPVQLHV